MLELKNISKTFNPGTVNEKLALQKIDLNLKDGDFATIVGSNGAGKSTMFNAIAGEFISDTGTITLDGQDITFMPDYRRSKYIGRMFQDPLRGTAPHMTIEETSRWPICGRPGTRRPSPASPKRIATSLPRSSPPWGWGWRTA